ncbi:C-Maf-inducing protein [Temnothorax longispinosus]|uniref:C-Maf-inducing protein n=1 Tax=Temnothorax longispinosus TaxID=300112 RepID=A0A4S2L2L2_9HYME|nr:C-Maf-inducing protein [Temnothorax longispinosus]
MFLPKHSGRIPSQSVALLSTGKSKSLLTNVILSLTRRTQDVQREQAQPTQFRGDQRSNFSIPRYIDQEAWESGGNSTDTIDYFDLEPLPGADADFAERNNGRFEQ